MVDERDASLKLGFDAGSVAFKAVVIDDAGKLVERRYRRTLGRPVEMALEVLGELLGRYGADAFALVAGTGSAGRLICQLLDVPFVNEVICQATAVRKLNPDVRTVIEMGGQDSKLIFLPEPGSNGQAMTDFVMNSNCAAGTGSFLDQQASRLGISIEEEFGELALKSVSPPRVAGRCSVFAKSDMIHLQQQAAPVHDIVAGLCLGLARNLKSNLGRGMELERPVAFCGGVASNKGVVRAFEQVLGMKSGELVVPEWHACTGALGAVLISDHEGKKIAGSIDLSALQRYLDEPRSIGHRVEPLGGGKEDRRQKTEGRSNKEGEQVVLPTAHCPPPTALIDAWFGLDVGSISTKAAVIDADNRVLAKVYLMTAGRPLEAVRKVLSDIGRQVEGKVRIRGAATTGSGRYLTGDFIGADLVINEITAQATAAAAIDPLVDTIFEIGGQDSKYISLENGVVVDFEMNHACAAGTGSFLEEQAERLGINIKTQFADLAMKSKSPIRLGERCTVFMESDMLSYQQQGAALEDLVAGLCYSIVSNYINRVVGHRKVGKRIFFQGGTAFNKGVVAAFEKFTGSAITVPPDHEVTGAIGAALLARKHQERLQGSGFGVRDSEANVEHRTSNSEHRTVDTKFGGFELAEMQCTIRSFECEHCSNHCEINEVTIPGRDPLYYGSRCDRYNVKKTSGHDEERIPNLFTERTRLLVKHANLKKHPNGPTIGIPLALSNYQLLPLWGTLLSELGFNVVVSFVSTPKVVQRGVEAVLSTPCFPVKVAHGHILELIEKGVDRIWLPSLVTMPQDSAENELNQLCPYVTSLPYQMEAAAEAGGKRVTLLKPPVRMQDGLADLWKSLKPMTRELGATTRQLRAAVQKAWQAQGDFERACRQRGREVLENLPPDQRAVVIVSRPYNGCDIGVCLDLPNKLRRLSVLPIPIDFLDLSRPEDSGDKVVQNMYWKYGQRILRAAEIVRQDPRLHAVYLSNFGCGPDSFLITFFKRMMAPKPALVLEIDEHSADAGVVTRLEAFLESLSHAEGGTLPRRLPLYPTQSTNGHQRTLYIPWMGDMAYGMAAAFRAMGQPSEVIPMADQQSMELGRRACSGKECLPCIITAGDMIRLTRRPGFDKDAAAFFMPGGCGPCRFGQYNAMHRLILDDQGLGDVPLFSPSDDKTFYEHFKKFGSDFTRMAWYGMCSIELLTKLLLATRPYELVAGETDRVYADCRELLCRIVERRPKLNELAKGMEEAAKAFAAVRVDRSQAKPRIGILGEIYVRHHDFSNNNVIRELEKLGAEASLAGFAEYLYYTNWTRMEQARRTGSYRLWLSNLLTDRVQRHIHHKLARAIGSRVARRESQVPDPSARNPKSETRNPNINDLLHEPPTREILDSAEPYLHRSFEGEAILSVGKLVEFHRQGYAGVVNVMPFTCMPSTVVSGLVKKITRRCGHVPVLSINYDGQQDPTLQTRLEAFIHQAKVYGEKREHDLVTR